MICCEGVVTISIILLICIRLLYTVSRNAVTIDPGGSRCRWASPQKPVRIATSRDVPCRMTPVRSSSQLRPPIPARAAAVIRGGLEFSPRRREEREDGQAPVRRRGRSRSPFVRQGPNLQSLGWFQGRGRSETRPTTRPTPSSLERGAQVWTKPRESSNLWGTGLVHKFGALPRKFGKTAEK